VVNIVRNKERTKRPLLQELSEANQEIIMSKDVENEHSETNETLQEIENRYRFIAENVVVWIVDMNLHCTYLSPSTTRMLGYSVEEAMTLSMQDVLTPSSLDIAMTAIRKKLGAAKAGRKNMFAPWTVELELRDKKGSTVWEESTLSFLRDPDGFPVGIIGIARDVTERKRAQELFRILADSLPIGVYISQNVKLRYVNHHFKHYSGYNEDELVGTDAMTIVYREDQDMVKKYRKEMLSDKRLLPYTFRFVNKAGETKWVMERVASIQHQGTRATLANFMDVTEHKDAEEVLRTSESRLRLLSERVYEVQEQERARIARDLHDQLGQELVALKIEAVSLAEQLGEENRLYGRAKSIMDLVDRLSATSHRIAVDLRPGMLDKLGLMKAMQWYAENFERRSGISCPVEIPAEEISIPQKTATTAYRILQEALTNVWKHSRASQVRIRVDTKNNFIVIGICDNGIGVDLRHLTDASSLGLLSMRERALLVGGTLIINGNVGKGMKVTTRLPLSIS